jgi:creatinine amidohydrolase
MKFTGTLTLKQTTLTEVIYDILESLNRNGVKKVVLVNSHGGNIGPLSAAINMIGSKIDGQHFLVTYWNLVSDIVKETRLSEFGGISHACELETSLKLYLSPEDVRKDLMTQNIIKGNDYWSPEMFASNKVTLYKSFEKMSQLGHVGDPTKASIQTGEIVFNAIVTEMIKLVQFIHDGGFEDENC